MLDESNLEVEEYGDDSIDQQEGADRIRKRPASMLGSDGIDGARHGVIEIIGNSCDEKTSGFGTKLEIGYYDDDSISVRDYGRGVPLGWNKNKKKWNYFLVYEELYAGGKYNDLQEKLHNLNWDKVTADNLPMLIPYLFSVGLNGVGAAATQYTSEYFEVTSYRKGIARTMKYRDGKHILDALIEEETTEPDGTYIKWKPDARVFSKAVLGEKWVKNLCEDISFSMGFDVTFRCGDKIIEYTHSTITDRIKESCGSVLSNKTYTKSIDDLGDILVGISEVAIGPGGGCNDFFHNGVRVKGGIHSEAVNNAIAEFFIKRGKDRGVRINSSDYSGLMSCMVSSMGNKKSYRGQTKDSIDDNYVYFCIYDNLIGIFEDAWVKGISWVEDMVDVAVRNAENRMAVAQLAKDVKEIEKSVRSAKVSDKFKSCKAYEEKRYEEVEVMIVEGDSAGSSATNSRNADFQAIFPIRGKSLNVFKAALAQIIANREIKDIVAFLGCGVDMGIEGYESFNIDKLKVGKVIFLTDADKDGYHIRILLFLIFYKLFPELLYRGLVYIAESPIHCAWLSDGTVKYCYTEAEYDEVVNTYGQGAIVKHQRYKGLGEFNDEELAKTTMNPANRRLIQVKLDRNDVDAYDTLEALFGKSTDRRKKAILGSLINDDYDEMVESIEEMIEYVDNLDLNDLDIEEVML